MTWITEILQTTTYEGKHKDWDGCRNLSVYFSPICQYMGQPGPEHKEFGNAQGNKGNEDKSVLGENLHT